MERINLSYDLLYASRPDCLLWGEQPGRLLINLPIRVAGTRVLDVGCGDGKNALYLEKLGCIVSGFDKSTHALNGLRHRFARAGWEPTGRYQLGDIYELGFLGSATYDIIVSYGLFHCLRRSDRMEVHRKLQQKLNAGGLLIFTCLLDSIPLPSDHSTPDVELANKEEIVELFADLKVVTWFDGMISESHLPRTALHEHAATWAICRRE